MKSADVVNLFSGFCAIVLVLIFAIATCCSKSGRRESKRELEGEDGEITAKDAKDAKEQKTRSPWCPLCQDFECMSTYGRCPHERA